LQTLIQARDIDDWTGNGDALPLGYRILGSTDASGDFGTGARIYYYFSLQAVGTGESTRDSTVTASVRTGANLEWTFERALTYIPPDLNVFNFASLRGMIGKFRNVSVNTSRQNGIDETIKFNTLAINDNNNQTLDYDLSFFDIDESVPNAEKRVLNYWKLSNGNPISLGWNSADATQLNVKSQDFIKTFLGQLYKLPTKILTLSGRQDTHLYPYHIMRRSTDNGLLLKWDRLEWNMKMMMFNGEGSEVGSDTAVSLKAFKDDAFTNGFS
jgi:hypothetical protein